jgi:hypothetical protein
LLQVFKKILNNDFIGSKIFLTVSGSRWDWLGGWESYSENFNIEFYILIRYSVSITALMKLETIEITVFVTS